MAVGRWAGRVSFLSPTPTGLRLVLAEVAGAAWLSLVPAMFDWVPAPLVSLFGEFKPCQEASIAPLYPPQEQKVGPPVVSVSEIAGVTSWAGLEPAGGGGCLSRNVALSGRASCGAVEWTWKPRAPYGGSEPESFGRQATDKNRSDLGTVSELSTPQFPHL